MLAKLRNRLSDESGSVLAIASVMMVSILGLAALVVDLGQWYAAQRQAQTAADAAALAGADDLPSSASKATTDANSYVTTNFSGASSTPTTPYSSNSSEIKVTVTKSVPSTFGGIFGIGSETVTASAVAVHNAAAASAAVFAMDTNCGDSGLVFNGTVNIPGGAATNSSFWQNGNSGVYGSSYYGKGCSYHPNGSGNTYNGATTPTQATAAQPWPIDYTKLSYTCNAGTAVGSGTIAYQNSPSTVSGIICANQINFNVAGMNGHATFIACGFQLNGNPQTITPYWNGVLIYQVSGGACGTGGTLTVDVNSQPNWLQGGAIFAPSASINVNGDSGTFSGFIEGYDVTITGGSPGSPFIMNSTASTTGSGGSALLQ
jgi:Flp pilus assembly protein TadG